MFSVKVLRFIGRKAESVVLAKKIHTLQDKAVKMGRFGRLTSYEAPVWAKSLVGCPREKIQLAHLNTPVEEWNLPGLPDNIQVLIKRDDMTGSSLGGNKNADEIGCLGNVFLDKVSSANIYLSPRKSPYASELLPRMELLAKKIKEDTGEESYLIEVGGSSHVGTFGYLECFHEIMNQGLLDEVDDVAFACGSGGTAEGLSIANYLTESKLRIHPIAVSDDASYFHSHGDVILKQLGIKDTRMCDLVDVVEGAKGKGYGISSEDEIDFIQLVAQKTGIILDPVYTGKAVKALVKALRDNPGRFQGNRILFIHTGGIFGAMDGRLIPAADKTASLKTWMWPDKEQCPI